MIRKDNVKDVEVPYESACHLTAFCIDCGVPAATPSVDLTAYFYERIDRSMLSAIRGLLTIQVLVDTTGKSCTKGFNNNTLGTPADILAMKLDTIVNSMPAWQPAMDQGKPENATVFIDIYSFVVGRKEFEVEMFRIGKNIKWKAAEKK